MTLAELKKLVKDGEGLHTEFKHKVSSDPLKILREVVAFANTEGGKLLIGVDDDKNLTGLKYADEEQYVLCKAMAEHCPTVQYDIDKVPLNSKREILIFTIYESIAKPIFLIYNLQKNTGVAYVRVEDRSVQSSPEMRKILKAQTQNVEQKFEYGENQSKLMRYLNEQSKIDVFTYAKIANIPPKEASEILVTLTLCNVLQIHPDETLDYYTLKSQDLSVMTKGSFHTKNPKV